MKQNLKKFVKKFPVLEKYFRMFRSGNKISETIPEKIVVGKNNSIHVVASAILYNCKFDIVGNSNEIEIGASSVLHNVTFFIRGNNNKVKLGQCLKFNRGGSIWVEDDSCEAIIGDNSTFEDVHIAVTESNSKIQIGSDCMFAYDIDLRTGDSHSIIDTVTNQRINRAQNISIGNHVWIAAHVSILKGVTISDHSIVATRAVVTKSFDEKNILIGGMPAKKLKEGVSWDRLRLP